MTTKKTAGKKKVKDLKLNKETVENLSDKSAKIKGGVGVSATNVACSAAGCVFKK
jgi:hypothetical protein